MKTLGQVGPRIVGERVKIPERRHIIQMTIFYKQDTDVTSLDKPWKKTFKSKYKFLKLNIMMARSHGHCRLLGTSSPKGESLAYSRTSFIRYAIGFVHASC